MAETSAWMPLYIGDYIRDTGHLTGGEHGAYLLLLMQAWTRGGALPADDNKLRLLARTSPKDWEASRATIMEFFYLKDGFYRQKRLDQELATATAITEQRRSAANARWGKSKGGRISGVDASAYAEGDANGMQTASPSHSPSPSPSTKNLEPSPGTPPSPRKRGVRSSDADHDFERFWEAYPRKVKKATASKAFAKALKRTNIDTILGALERQPAARNGGDFEPYPATWLNADSWLDEHETRDPALTALGITDDDVQDFLNFEGKPH